MTGTSDEIGLKALRYRKSFGQKARACLSVDLSRALGRHDWDVAHLLQRVDLRLLRLEFAGYFDGGRVG